MKKSIVKNSIKIVALCFALTNLFSCKSNENQTTDVRTPYVVPDSLMKTLSIDTVKTSDITDALKFNGTVDYNTNNLVSVFPLVSGNVQNISVMPGDYVHKGQVLGIIKSAEVANYNSSLTDAQASVRLTARQLAQQKELYKSGLASQVDITNAEVAHEQAQAAQTAAQQVLSVNGNNRNGEYIIKAPIDGFIVQKNVNNGMSIRTDNNTGLLTISDLRNVWVQANVYEENIAKVKQGDPVDVSIISYPDQIFKGKVNEMMNVLDPTSKVLKMRVVLDNPKYLLKPGMFATISLNDDENKKGISVSSKALVFDHSQYYVITVKGKKDVQIRPVEVISINGPTAYIKSGLAPGERVVASNALLIYGSLNS